MYRKCRSIGNAVICPDELDPDLSENNALPVDNSLELDLLGNLEFLEFVLYEADRKSCGINGHRQLGEDVGKCPYMILMSVRDHKTLYFFDIVREVCDIGHYKVDTEHVILRECYSAINDHDSILVLDGRNVHPDLLKSAERDDFDFILFFHFYSSNLSTTISISPSRTSLKSPVTAASSSSSSTIS